MKSMNYEDTSLGTAKALVGMTEHITKRRFKISLKK